MGYAQNNPLWWHLWCRFEGQGSNVIHHHLRSQLPCTTRYPSPTMPSQSRSCYCWRSSLSIGSPEWIQPTNNHCTRGSKTEGPHQEFQQQHDVDSKHGSQILLTKNKKRIGWCTQQKDWNDQNTFQEAFRDDHLHWLWTTWVVRFFLHFGVVGVDKSLLRRADI